MLLYTGPVALPGSMQSEQITPVRLANAVAVSSDAGGQIFFTVDNDPSRYLDWSGYTALYNAYRVLAIRLRWIPNDIGFPSGASAAVQRPLVTWVRRNVPGSPAAPSSVAAAYDNDGARVQNVGKQWSQTLRADGNPDLDWKAVSAPVQTFQVQIYGNSFTASTVYGQVFQDCLVQLKNRQ